MRFHLINRSTKQEQRSEEERASVDAARVATKKILDQQFDSLFALMHDTLNTIKGAEAEVGETPKDKEAGNER